MPHSAARPTIAKSVTVLAPRQPSVFFFGRTSYVRKVPSARPSPEVRPGWGLPCGWGVGRARCTSMIVVRLLVSRRRAGLTTWSPGLLGDNGERGQVPRARAHARVITHWRRRDRWPGGRPAWGAAGSAAHAADPVGSREFGRVSLSVQICADIWRPVRHTYSTHRHRRDTAAMAAAGSAARGISGIGAAPARAAPRRAARAGRRGAQGGKGRRAAARAAEETARADPADARSVVGVVSGAWEGTHARIEAARSCCGVPMDAANRRAEHKGACTTN